MSIGLAGLQADFLRMLRDEQHDLRNAVADGGKIDTERRLHIYHHAYQVRLLAVLQDVFEHTWTYLGDEVFERCALHYVAAHPPSARTLQRFGAGFPCWLTEEFPDDRDIADVAMIDWLMRTTFDGPDGDVLTLEQLARVAPADWASVGFDFHPTLELAPLTYNAASIWEALHGGQPPPPAERLSTPTWLRLWRKEFQPHFVSIDEIEMQALRALRAGHSFASVCEQLAEQFPESNVAAILGVTLRRWVDDQMLAGVHFRGPAEEKYKGSSD